MQTSDWIALGSLVVALLAAAQPWAILAWNKYVRVGQLDIYFTGFPEIGFSDHGPTITLSGTIVAIHRDVFVEKLEIEVQRRDTGETHSFTWVAFKGSELYLARPDDIALSIPFGFMVTKSSPKPFNIFFADRDTQSKIIPHVREVEQEVIDKFQDPIIGGEIARIDRSANPLGVHKIVEKEIEKSSTRTNAYAEIKNQYYWKEGKYLLKLRAKCARPGREFVKSGSFALTKSDRERLESNTVVIIESRVRLACGLPEWNYGFVSPELDSEES